jgi:hypothetical protein
MAKQIRFSYNGVDYTLEFTRESIAQLERQGLVASEITDKPMTVLPALFAGSFIANHRFTKQALIKEIFEKMPDKAQLIAKLLEMFNEPLETMMDDPEDSEGNVKWEGSW